VRTKNEGEEFVMQVVLRKYSGKGAKELFDLLEKNTTELQKLLLPIQGFVSYTLARNEDGGFSVTVCQDKGGIDQAFKRRKPGSLRTPWVSAPRRQKSPQAMSFFI
jgi:hypothetical protein